MRFTSTHSLATALWLAAAAFCVSAPGMSARAAGNSNVADEYLSGYIILQDAQALEEKGKHESAYKKYREASAIFDEVANKYPTWQPQVVTFRRKKIRESLTRVYGLIPDTSPLKSKSKPGPGGHDNPSYDRTRPTPGTRVPYTGGAAGTLARKDAELRALATERDKLLDDLEFKGRTLERTKILLDQARRAQESLAEQLRQAQVAAANGGGAEEVSRLKKELAIANDSLAAHDKRMIDIRAAHEKALTDIKTLKAERDALRKERDELSTLLQKAEAGEMKQLIAENLSLKQQLQEAQTEMKRLRKDNADKDQEIAGLKNKIKSVESQLAKLQEENTNYKRRIASLSETLRKTSKQLGDALEKSREGIQEDILRENEVLQKIIARQLQQQSRRRQARQLVMSELSKLKITSESLLKNIDRMEGGGFALTDEEREIFQAPIFKDMVDEAGGMKAAIFAKADDNGEFPELPDITNNDGPKNRFGLNADLTQFAKAAAYDFMQGKFHQAADAYERILKIVPLNVYTLRNLGIVKIRLNESEEAEQLFRKAIAREPEEDYSHFILGYLYYKQRSYDKATAAMERVVQINPGNAKAHHYLGVICLENAKTDKSRAAMLRDKARTEFKRVVSIDPKFLDAHFNLAVLYITAPTPERQLARQHYITYLKAGGQPDKVMERAVGT